jgi:hypothetical protein
MCLRARMARACARGHAPHKIRRECLAPAERGPPDPRSVAHRRRHFNERVRVRRVQRPLVLLLKCAHHCARARAAGRRAREIRGSR